MLNTFALSSSRRAAEPRKGAGVVWKRMLPYHIRSGERAGASKRLHQKLIDS